MKLIDVMLLGVAFMFIIIGIDQTIVLGFSKGYWAFMLALMSFFLFNYRKSKRQNPPDDPSPKGPKKHKVK